MTRAVFLVLPGVEQAERAGARLLSICTGAFLLAQAGLLDGRECTTHWRFVELLQERFPSAKVARGQDSGTFPSVS